ncbi:hypothetical protein [Tardiphaga sp. P9-11]|uniref:hypothetical protein n=1 Tax=Tardiphaga sp. P9-11 TaxID=2024614 RepID=UPI0011F0C725|nr:hypothetical protein [Tardiphaga sp. P9-11]KAA0075911.1 hypothetical protein CIW50_06475 [Tardiphaga sp. P9-11]
MSAHITFISKAKRPDQRLSDFIDLSRNKIHALIDDNEWDRDLWQVGDQFVLKGQNPSEKVLSFYNREAVLGNRHSIAGEPLDDAFKDFAKAYIRYRHSAEPVGFGSTKHRLVGLAIIEAGFRRLGLEPKIENLTAHVLHAGLSQARDEVSSSRFYKFAVYVQQVLEFCKERQFLNAPFNWKHGVRKPEEARETLGREAKDRRDKILPSPEAFRALGHVFCNAETFADRFYSAIAAICVCIPVRAHEVLELKIDCEVLGETQEADVYGIRIRPGKGKAPQVKWVPTPMVSVAREAVERLKELSAEARNVAKWYEESPDELWLPRELRRFRKEGFISLTDVQRLIVGAELSQLPVVLRRRGIELRDSDRKVSLSSLASNLLSYMPQGYPYLNGKRGQRYSETLAILLRNQAGLQKPTFSCLVAKATVQSFERWLSGITGRDDSVFQRWKFRERDGAEIKVTTKSFRHWINTIAQLKGLSELDIATWSGRDVAQNQAYDHVTADERLSQIWQAIDDGKTIGPMFEVPAEVGVNPPVSLQDFLNAQIGSAHITDYGICVHDYTLQPCGVHGNCFDCSESVFVKGDVAHAEKIQQQLDIASRQVTEAMDNIDSAFSQADRWLAAHHKKVDRLQLIIGIHQNDSVEDGTIVSLPNATRDSEVAVALRERSKQGLMVT